MSQHHETLIDLLLHRAAQSSTASGYTFLGPNLESTDQLELPDLARRSLALANVLAEICRPGDRALLLHPPGLDFLPAFFGCLAAGVIAVPVIPPHPVFPERSAARLSAVARGARPAAILTAPALGGRLEALTETCPEIVDLPVLVGEDDARGRDSHWVRPALDGESAAFLQFTSGSTAEPRGVMVRHRNLLHNLGFIHRFLDPHTEHRSVSWLPVFHDMGLIEGVLHPLYGAHRAWLMAPTSFLQRPVRWLQAISRIRATISGAPDFAFALCASRIDPAAHPDLDLSAWQVAYDGAEPVRPDTLDAFCARFSSCGFQRSALHPVYGLAESTLLVTATPRNRGPARLPGAVSCGRFSPDTEVVIVDPQRRARLADGESGEVWVRGPSVAAGYFELPEATRATFGAQLASGDGPFLRTGDLGFLEDGELYVNGRLKEILILRGCKYHPEDLEATVERSHPALRRGGCAALVVGKEGWEGLAILAEVDRHSLRAAASDLVEEVLRAVQAALSRSHGLVVDELRLLRPGALPRTTSGKLMRRGCGVFLAPEAERAVAGWSRLRKAS